jgi:hypothetical protein
MKLDKPNQQALAAWAADCAEHVLPFFEAKCPRDDRPRKAIELLRTWMRIGEVSMAEVRATSLAAHAAARAVDDDPAACAAARAAGQAAGTAHAPGHAGGAAWYAAKAAGLAAADVDPTAAIAREHEWQASRIPEALWPVVFPGRLWPISLPKRGRRVTTA